MQSSHETEWRSHLTIAVTHLQKSMALVNSELQAMLPTPDTIALYTEMRNAKQAMQAALQALKDAEKYLP